MAKTLLQLTNEVGKNLRRSTGSTYTSITQNQDAVFIVQAINEAKRMVEARWKWDVLTDTITFPSVASTDTYDTSSLSIVTSDPTVTRTRAVLLLDQFGRPQFYDVTDTAFQMQVITREQVYRKQLEYTSTFAKPQEVAVYQNGTGLTVHFAHTPSAARNYSFQCYNPQDDLTTASDTLTAPEKPVVLAATAIAVEERGEELGMQSSRYWEQYEDALGEAMSIDSTAADWQLRGDQTDYFNSGLSV